MVCSSCNYRLQIADCRLWYHFLAEMDAFLPARSRRLDIHIERFFRSQNEKTVRYEQEKSVFASDRASPGSEASPQRATCAMWYYDRLLAC
jgi:hypothetical protein